MSKRLIMHIGMPKTGSTALLDFLRRNREALAKAGITCPQQGRVRFLTGEGAGADELTAEWDQVRGALELNGKTVVLTDEALYHQLMHRPGRIRAIRDRLGDPEIRVVFYLRRQDLILESLYREIVRGLAGPVLDLDYGQISQIMGSDFLDYDAAVRFFRKELGENAVTVRVFEHQALEQGCLFHDFCSVLGVPWSKDFRLPEGETNKAADARLTGLFLQVNAFYGSDSYKARQLKEILEEIGRAYFREQEDRLLSSAERHALLQRFEAGNTALARSLGLGERLFSQDDLAQNNEPRTLTPQDRDMLLLGLNRAWVRGMGAVPFRVYNLEKLRYLRLRLPTVSSPRRVLLRVQLAFHEALRLFWALLPMRWTDAEAEEQALRYLAKDLRLLRQNGEEWLPRSED